MNFISIKLQNLIVRACKSKNPERRLESLYKRFYLGDIQNTEYIMEVMNVNMLCIIDAFKLTDLYEFYKQTTDTIGFCNGVYHNDLIDHKKLIGNFRRCVFEGSIKIIRYTEIDKFIIKEKNVEIKLKFKNRK